VTLTLSAYQASLVKQIGSYFRKMQASQSTEDKTKQAQCAPKVYVKGYDLVFTTVTNIVSVRSVT